MEKRLRPVVIAGPSGVGKSTNITRLMKEFPETYGFSVSHTSRLPRPGETDGVQYHFVTPDKFKEEIEKGVFIEWASYAGNYYGTTVGALQDVERKGRVALLDIDLQGVKSLKAVDKSVVDPFYLVLVPPSMDDLRHRLEGRGDTSPGAMRKRLDTAKVELEHSRIPGFFDRVITSGEREETYAQFKEAMLESSKV